MKKILTILLMLSLVLTAVACQNDKDPQTPPAEEVGDLKEAVTEMLEKSDHKDMLGDSFMFEPLSQEEAAYLIGAESLEASFEEALGLQPMINVHPFALGIFRLDKDQDAQAFARELKDKADLRKWICVAADDVVTATKGQTVLFIMGSADEVNSIAQASGFTAVQ